MEARKYDRINARGTVTEWTEVLEDLEEAFSEWDGDLNDGTKYLMIAIRNALK